jgi:hypothetical protein
MGPGWCADNIVLTLNQLIEYADLCFYVSEKVPFCRSLWCSSMLVSKI